MTARRSLSVSQETGHRLAAYSETSGVSMGQLVEFLVLAVMSGDEPIPERVIAVGRRGSRYTGRLQPSGWTPPVQDPPPDRDHIDQLAAQRRILAAIRAAPPAAALSPTVDFKVSAALEQAIRDLVTRAAADGVEVQPGDILDRAIGRMLDVLERSKWCRLCLETIGDCRCR